MNRNFRNRRKRQDEIKKFHRTGYDKQKLDEFYSRNEQQLQRLRDVGILVEKMDFGKRIQISYDRRTYLFYPATNQFSFNNYKNYFKSVDKFDEFVDKILILSNRSFNGKEQYYRSELSTLEEEDLYRTNPIIQDVDLGILKYLSRDYSSIHNVSPRKFEELVARILSDAGFDVELTGKTRDGGKDILAYYSNDIMSFLTYVECKRYARNKPVGVQTVREVYGVQQINKANKSLIVTTSYFSRDAIKEQNMIYREMDLRDHNSLKDWLIKYK